MLNIRLSRVGKTNQPSFRVVVQEHTASPKGKFIESIGFYSPISKQFKADLGRINHWISVGAKPSDSLAVLLKKNGVEGMDKFITLRNKKRKKKGEKEEKPAAPEVKAEAPKAEAKVEEPKVEETPKAEEAPQA